MKTKKQKHKAGSLQRIVKQPFSVGQRIRNKYCGCVGVVTKHTVRGFKWKLDNRQHTIKQTMKLKLTALQEHKARSAHQNASDVLREIKSKPLKGEALKDMKTLEEAVQCLEVFVIGR